MTVSNSDEIEKNRLRFLTEIYPIKFSTYFIYPFQFESMEMKALKQCFSHDKWEEDQFKPYENSEDYNTYHYFYKYIQKILFPGPDNKTLLSLKFRGTDLSYNVELMGGQGYECPLKAITLYLYSAGIGFLVFCLEDDFTKKKNGEKVHNLKYYLGLIDTGRRLYPAYLNTENKLSSTAGLSITNYEKGVNAFTTKECPIKVSIKTGKEKLCENDFTSFPGIGENRIVRNLLGSLKYDHIIDDRMFSHCYYQLKKTDQKFLSTLDEHFSKVHNPRNQEKRIGALKVLYQSIFIEHGDPTCPNVQDMIKLLDQSVYTRWSPYGSLYGFSRYSSVFITTAEFIHGYFRGMYYQMGLLLFFYRVMLQKFSTASSEIGQLIHEGQSDSQVKEEAEKLKKEFIRFRNTYWFKEITHQDQGIEMYHLWESKMNVNNLLEDIKQEIDEIYGYLDHQNEQKIDSGINRLSVIGFIFLPVSIVIGIWSMPGFDFKSWKESFHSSDPGPAAGWEWVKWCIIGFIIFLSLYGVLELGGKIRRWFFKKMLKSRKKKKLLKK